jgi:hypothetical protein
LALGIVGTAAAANSGSFLDEVGDARPAPDIRRVAVASDDAGVVTIRVEIADRATLAAEDNVTVGIDADQNPDTGSVLYGADFALDLVGSNAAFLRPSPDGFLAEAAAPQSFQASFAGGVATFAFKATEVGMSPTSGFGVFAWGFATGAIDNAPDMRAVNYQMVPGTPPAVPPADRRAPVDEAIRSTGARGRVARLLYFAADGRGETSDTIRVLRGKRQLRRIVTPLEDTNPFFRYSVGWRVPRTIRRGTLRFCVSSVDGAGNRGNVSCAPLTIR